MKSRILALVLLAGCGSVPAAYVDADEKFYEAVAPEYEGYVRSGLQFSREGVMVVDSQAYPVLLTEEQREDRLRTLRLQRTVLDEAKAALQREAE